MKKIKIPSHQDLAKDDFKDAKFKERIDAGVRRLQVVSQIVARRKELKITQAELARRVGVSQPFIAKIENDKTANLSLETLIKITDALEAKIEITISSLPDAA